MFAAFKAYKGSRRRLHGCADLVLLLTLDSGADFPHIFSNCFKQHFLKILRQVWHRQLQERRRPGGLLPQGLRRVLLHGRPRAGAQPGPWHKRKYFLWKTSLNLNFGKRAAPTMRSTAATLTSTATGSGSTWSRRSGGQSWRNFWIFHSQNF